MESYDFRKRKQKPMYMSPGSESEHEDDSSYSDPDYTRTRSQRKKQKTIAEMEEARVVRRGRPRKRRANGEGEVKSSQERKKRTNKQASCSSPSTSNRNAYEVKRTILSWLIDLNIVKENEKVYYMNENHDRVVLEGIITRAGVLCRCCDKEITVYEFEHHAGSDTRKPYANIFLANSYVSLLKCQKDAWHCSEEVANRTFNQVQPRDGASDKNDDACMICGDGGDLICCDRCPSTFHPNCMDMEGIPHGDWLCPFCVCTYCDSGDDLHTCIQCEKKYHLECFRGRELLDLNSPNTSFCGSSCTEIYEKLQKMVGIRNEIDEALSWTLIRSIEPAGSDLFSGDMHKDVQCNSKIAVAWRVMNECFLTNTDRHTKINVVQSVVYNRGSNLTRINFSGFYTAILEMDDEIISAASLRIHGSKLAEMPYIATRQKYRCKGMSRKLMLEIESALCFLNVENLVIPSVEDLKSMWIGKYQFSHIHDSLREEILHSNTLMFPKTIRLQKTLLQEAPEPVVANNTAVMEVAKEQNENQNEPAPYENAASLVLLDLNLEPALLDLNLEPPEENKV